MSTSEGSIANAANRGADRIDNEPLHQLLHQIAELGERGAADLLVNALVESLPDDVLSRVAQSLSSLPTVR